MEDGIIVIVAVHLLIALILGMPRYFFRLRGEWREASKRIPKIAFGDEIKKLGTMPLEHSGSDNSFIKSLLWINRCVLLRPKSTPKNYFAIKEFVPPYSTSSGGSSLIVEEKRKCEIMMHSKGTERVQHLILSIKAGAKSSQRTIVTPTPSGPENLVRAVTVKVEPTNVNANGIVYEVVQPKLRESEITAICYVSEVPTNSIHLHPTEFEGKDEVIDLYDLNDVPHWSPARNLFRWRISMPIFLLGYILGFFGGFLDTLGLPLAVVYLLIQAICGSAFGMLLIHETLNIMEKRWEK